MTAEQDTKQQQTQTVSPAELFDTLWNELRGTLGSAPAAALLRRAIVVSHESCPILSSITIEKSGRDYAYTIPPEIRDDARMATELATFVGNVMSLLKELTGNVLVRHLMDIPIIKMVCEKR